ncbi:hypothetical protein LJC56_09275 [Christensenellaceae bacterium OttesenSCG-928-K19]|nr:hypothetical protein [Christensenellaceae bacterium OttesenSCG-928-K19]
MKTRIHAVAELVYGNIVITSYTLPNGTTLPVDRSFYGGTAVIGDEEMRRFEVVTGTNRRFLYLDDDGRWFVVRS